MTGLTSNPFIAVAVCEQPEQVADAAGEDEQQLQQVLHLHLPGDRGRGQPGPRHRPRQGGRQGQGEDLLSSQNIHRDIVKWLCE